MKNNLILDFAESLAKIKINGRPCSCSDVKKIISLAGVVKKAGNNHLAEKILKVAYPAKLPAEAKDVYDKCKESGHTDEYCSRISWEIYCQHMNPNDKSCTEIGKSEEVETPLAEANDKEKQYALSMVSILSGMKKLASDLEDMGAEDAAQLVDDAIKVIVYNIE